MREFLQEFQKFILRGNVVDLAVGLIIGAAFTNIINSLVKDIFMPILGLLTGGFDLSGQTITLYGDARLGWGNFAQSTITFLIIGFCLFLVVKAMNRLREWAPLPAVPPPEPAETEKLLREIRDLLRDQASRQSPSPANPPAAP
ncbi:MAG: large conductance mechanosensitive channel protein MscL [Thermogemmata sp.]|jgi:large conductance mechanosensitive channel